MGFYYRWKTNFLNVDNTSPEGDETSKQGNCNKTVLIGASFHQIGNIITKNKAIHTTTIMWTESMINDDPLGTTRTNISIMGSNKIWLHTPRGAGHRWHKKIFLWGHTHVNQRKNIGQKIERVDDIYLWQGASPPVKIVQLLCTKFIWWKWEYPDRAFMVWHVCAFII